MVLRRRQNKRFHYVESWDQPEFKPEVLKKLNAKKPRTVFIDSMSDIGCWRLEWLVAVMQAMANNSQHKYIALTKTSIAKLNDKIGDALANVDGDFDLFIGKSITTQAQADAFSAENEIIDFLSIEPLLEPSGTLKAGCNDHAVCLPKPIGFNYTNSITAKTNPTIDKAETLRASGGGGAAVCYALDRASFNQGANAQYNPSITDNGISQTIVSKGPGAVCAQPSAVGVDPYNGAIDGSVASTLGVHCGLSTGRSAVMQQLTYCLQGNGIDRSETAGCNGKGIKEGVYYTLNTIDRPAVSDGAEGYIVRRLTPLECERLQGFPDGWTDIGEWIDEKGKTRQTTDAVRYKALGNSIAIPPWKWVLKRLCAYYERDATMASLFDGIGGFPLIWEQLNGRGSCLWASEIEEFPLAVTKKHFQGVTA